MRYAIFAVMAATRCAPLPASIPVSYPATLDVNFDEVESGRCNPAINGYVISFRGAEELVKGVRRTQRDAAVKVIEAERDRDIARARLEESAADKPWALVGKIGTAGIAGAAIVAAIVAIANAFGGTK